MNELISRFVNSNVSSDKVHHHGYQRFYPLFLDQLRSERNLCMLELGYLKGESIELWNNYFAAPEIHSMDIIKDPNDPRLSSYYCINQEDNLSVERFASNKKEKFHFIIDDASHVPKHQWNSINALFSTLKPGGIYIIEDIETSYWGDSEIYGQRIKPSDVSTFEMIQIIMNAINMEFIREKRLLNKISKTKYAFIFEVESMFIGHNCLIFIKKDYNKYKQYYRSNNEYRYKNNYNTNLRVLSIRKLLSRFFKGAGKKA